MKEIFIATILKNDVVAFHQISHSFKKYISTLEYFKKEIENGKTEFLEEYLEVKQTIENVKEALNGKLSLLIIDQPDFSDMKSLINMIADYDRSEFP